MGQPVAMFEIISTDHERLGAWLERAEGLGATRLVEPTDLPDGYGSFAMLADPDRNPVGLWA